MDHITWDREKDRLNQAKHGVTFAEAREAMADPLNRRWPDTAHSRLEPRSITIGEDRQQQLLLVVTAGDPGGTIRIISARRATKRERHAYEAR